MTRVLLLLLALAGLARAEDPPAERAAATLDPAGRAVVISGAHLPAAVRGLRPAQLWLGAWREGSLRPIPFQVDERVPGGDYAWSEGDERKRDVDEGHLDDDDELAFYARDAGDRAPVSQLRQGQTAALELELTDPGRGGRAWVYLLVFAEAEQAPPRAPDDRASLVFREDELVGLRGERLEVAGAAGGDNLLHLHELRLAGPGGWGPDILDRLKLTLTASYLFTGIERAQDEVRAGLRAWRDGPVRVVARGSVETYLIWGHWIRSVPGGARLTMWEDRLELSCAVRLPIDLELDAKSELRVSLDLSPEVPDLRVWSDTNPRPLRAGEPIPRALDRSAPGWIAIGGEGGALFARLTPGDSLRRPGNALFLRDDAQGDPPEDFPGSHGNAGWSLDLTGMRSGVHALSLELRAGPLLEEGQLPDAGAWLAAAAAPLQVTVR